MPAHKCSRYIAPPHNSICCPNTNPRNIICKFCDNKYCTNSAVSTECLEEQIKILAHAIKCNFVNMDGRIIGNSESDADCTGSVGPAMKLIEDLGL